MAIRIVRLGTPRHEGEGLRLGTVRRPPRGVRKEDIPKRDFYDVWFPTLSPSPPLVAAALSATTEAEFRRFARGYRAEMKAPAAARDLDLLAALSHTTPLAVGCYCADPARCHRSLLRDLLRERGAAVIDEEGDPGFGHVSGPRGEGVPGIDDDRDDEAGPGPDTDDEDPSA